MESQDSDLGFRMDDADAISYRQAIQEEGGRGDGGLNFRHIEIEIPQGNPGSVGQMDLELML